MQALPEGALLLPADANQARCVCFHPNLQIAFVAVDGCVVEYDLTTRARLSTFPLHDGTILCLQFLASHQAWVAVFEDGRVLVVAGGAVLAELSCPRGAKEKWSLLCSAVQDSASLPMLFFVRKGSRAVQGGPLLSQSKSLWRLEGHKRPIMLIATHPSYPLLAAAADDGTIRIWRTDTLALYNIVEANKRHGSKGGGTIVTVALQFDRVPATTQKTAAGASPRKTGKKKLRTISVFFSKVRLIVAQEKGAIFLFDVSVPGAPSTLRTFNNPSAVLLAAHLHPSLPGLMFTLDSTGLYTAYTLSADPTLESKGKGQTSETMSFIQTADHIEPFQVNVTPKARSSVTSEWSLADEDGVVTSPATLPRALKAHMHPRGHHVLFTGEDVLPGPGRSEHLPVYRFRCGPFPEANPVVAPLTLPVDTFLPSPRWWTDKIPSAPSGVIYFVDSQPPALTLKMFTIHTQATTNLLSCKLPVTLGTAGERVPVMHNTAVRLVVSHSAVIRKEPGPRFLLFVKAALSRTSGGLVKVTARTRGLFPTPPTNADCQYRSLFTLLPHLALGSGGTPSANPADPWCFLPGLDGVFVGPDNSQFLIVGEHGFQLTVYGATKEAGTPVPLPLMVTRVFNTPFGSNCVVLYFSPSGSGGRLVYSANHEDHRSGDPGTMFSEKGLQPTGPAFRLEHEEVPLEVTWQPDALRSVSGHLVAVLTTRRLLLLRDSLVVLATVRPADSTIRSVFWLGRSLVYNTGTALRYVTTDGASEPLTAIPSEAAIVGALPDRLIGASKEDGKTTLWFKHLHVIDPLLHGLCTERNGDDLTDDALRCSLVKHVVTKFDCSRVGPSALLRLSALGFSDLVTRLGQQARGGGEQLSERLPWRDRLRHLLEARDADTALLLLSSVYLLHVTNNGTIAGNAKESSMQESSPFFAPFLDLLCCGVAGENTPVAAKALKMINNVVLVLRSLRQRADGRALRFVCRQCETVAPALLPLAKALVASVEGCGEPPEAAVVPKREWTLCSQVAEVRLSALISPPDGEEHWREEDVFLPPLPANNLPLILGVPPIEGGGAAEAGGGPGAVDYETADWGDGFAGGDDSASTVAPSDDYQTESLGEEDDEPKPMGESGATPSKPKGDGSDEDEDAVTKEQEKLREQYLASYGGGGDDDAEDSDEEGGPRKPRKRKIMIKISDTAVVKPQSVATAPIAISMAMPGPGASKRKPGRAGAMGGGPAAATPSEDSPDPTATSQSPAELFQVGLAAMDRGRFAEALKYLTGSCDLLVQDSTQIAKKAQIISVVQYKEALSILIKVKELEGPPGGPPCGPEVVQQLAFLTLLVVQLSLLPRHQLICQKMATRKNLDAGNWDGAARILKELIPAAPDNVRSQLEEQLRQCEDHGNTSVFPEPMRRDHIHFCWTTFKLLKPPGDATSAADADLNPAAVCTYCPAEFDALVHPTGGACPMCKFGQLEHPC